MRKHLSHAGIISPGSPPRRTEAEAAASPRHAAVETGWEAGLPLPPLLLLFLSFLVFYNKALSGAASVAALTGRSERRRRGVPGDELNAASQRDGALRKRDGVSASEGASKKWQTIEGKPGVEGGGSAEETKTARMLTAALHSEGDKERLTGQKEAAETGGMARRLQRADYESIIGG